MHYYIKLRIKIIAKKQKILQKTYFYAYTIFRSFNQLTRKSFFLFQYNWIAKFPTDKPLELAHSIFQVKYHLKNIKY